MKWVTDVTQEDYRKMPRARAAQPNSSFQVTLLIMGLLTTVIGVLPGYATIGIVAPSILFVSLGVILIVCGSMSSEAFEA